ncbi:hypothetical protein BKA82DRAFT_4063737 [Pisolithus tinctorius]|nr:hypothetical protein BKA82DRAFT_4063737 [Pisolithus tinctorius]
MAWKDNTQVDSDVVIRASSPSELTLVVQDYLPHPDTESQPEIQPTPDIDIAPWLHTPSLPPKRSFGFVQKPSLASIPFARSSSSAVSLRSRTNDSQSFLADPSDVYSNDSRKGNPLGFLSDIMRKRSRSKLSLDSGDTFATYPYPSLNPSMISMQDSTTSIRSYPPMSSSPQPPLKKERDKPRIRRPRLNKTVPLTHKDSSSELPFTLDTDISHMDGIVSPEVLEGPSNVSPSSVLDISGFTPPSPSATMFSDPFNSSSASSKRNAYYFHDFRKISPKSTLGPYRLEDQTHDRMSDGAWTAPESWAVEREEVFGPEEEVHSVSEEESLAASSSRSPDNGSAYNHTGTRRRGRRESRHSHKQTTTTNKFVRVRIYRDDGSYHVAQILPTSTVADLTPSLNAKVLLDQDRETHKLYLKERGRERVLAPTERPAAITRRRLEQAGYDQADSLDYIAAEDMTFLLKFVYKSQLLGPPEDLQFNELEYVDLTGCGLPTIPIILHKNAASIVYLNLSRNPMVEIPLDFIQSCATLRELRLSNMAMKKVPQSVRHSASLHRLDLSCNRIVDLDDAALERIPELNSLKLQNNRLEQLPWYLPRLCNLKYLNISNNKFVQLPSVICKLPALLDLDVSFNMITDLPEDIGELVQLEKLIFVGNNVSKIPEQFNRLVNLKVLDCRRNSISDLSFTHALPNLEVLSADHNYVHALDLSHWPRTTQRLEASHNDITLLKLVTPTPMPYALTSLDVSYAKLSSLDDFTLSHLSSLQHLTLDHNLFRALPEALGDLNHLLTLSCSDNHLDALPESIGRLQRLETLDAHNNSLTRIPASIWNCASLTMINVTSNLIEVWHDPPGTGLVSPPSTGITLDVPPDLPGGRHYPVRNLLSEESSHIPAPVRPAPPLAYSLERLYVGENRLTDESLPPFTVFKELRVLNLSFNVIQEMPSSFFRNLSKLEELYLSGNQLTSIPTEDLYKLTRLSVLFLNGNKLQTLPHELGKVQSLMVIDVGSNVLRYNINNWEFDWNWNFNKNLKYLNLSGNKRLEIKPEKSGNKPLSANEEESRAILADFSELHQLRVLGLMDVTTAFLPNIPDESEDRRVRTSLSEVNKMSYGIADNLGRNGYFSMFDLVQPNFRENQDEAVFAMFGRTHAALSNNHLSKYLHDNFLRQFTDHLNKLDKAKEESVTDALRRTFLRLNKLLHDSLYSSALPHRKLSQASVSTSATTPFDASYRGTGADGIVLYFTGKTLYVANAGQALAVISCRGSAEVISKRHNPFDRGETIRIRAAEGWISPKGLIHDTIDTSRAFGFFHDFPVVNARPDVYVRQLMEQDEFVIVANSGLWDYISYQTAVDIARSEISDPMIAAQKLRDFAISYGSDGSTMIMVICVADLFQSKQPVVDSVLDPDAYGAGKNRRPKKPDIADRTLARLGEEVPPPVGHLCLVFTDIRNSTQLWEANAGMPTAMRLHNSLLRRHLRICGGYVVKTEGDAFMCSFPTTLAALWWCLTIQVQLLHEPWPLEILECGEGREAYDAEGNLIARGLSVRMGLHCGTPVCEPDPITNRMDYFGPMVIRASRLSGHAAGGQIMCSADVVREINARITETGPYTEYSEFQPPTAIEAIRGMGIKVIPVGEIKLKGLEVPEMATLIYPAQVAGRMFMVPNSAPTSASVAPVKAQWSVDQVRELALLCLRFEALASSRVFKMHTELDLRDTTQPSGVNNPRGYLEGDLKLLLPPLNDKTTEHEVMTLLDSLLTRLENAASTLALKAMAEDSAAILSILRNHGGIDGRTLRVLSSSLGR